MSHTPGPWTHAGQGDITGIEDNGAGCGMVDVCAVYLRTVPGRFEANAHLIAAAPDLLAACKAVMHDYENFLWECRPLSESPCIEVVLAAIKKAEGV